MKTRKRILSAILALSMTSSMFSAFEKRFTRRKAKPSPTKSKTAANFMLRRPMSI